MYISNKLSESLKVKAVVPAASWRIRMKTEFKVDRENLEVLPAMAYEQFYINFL